MKDVSSGAVDKFTPAYEKSCSRYHVEFDTVYHEYDEETFNRVLELERKRSERSRGLSY